MCKEGQAQNTAGNLFPEPPGPTAAGIMVGRQKNKLQGRPKEGKGKGKGARGKGAGRRIGTK